MTLFMIRNQIYSNDHKKILRDILNNQPVILLEKPIKNKGIYNNFNIWRYDTRQNDTEQNDTIHNNNRKKI